RPSSGRPPRWSLRRTIFPSRRGAPSYPTTRSDRRARVPFARRGATPPRPRSAGASEEAGGGGDDRAADARADGEHDGGDGRRATLADGGHDAEHQPEE